MNNMKYVALLSLLVVLISCSNDTGNDSPVVATSGKARLHLDEISSFWTDNTGLDISKIQVQNYIQRWAEKELIYQHALSDDYHKHPDIQKKLYELEKDFIVAAFLHEKIDNELSVTESDIEAYYDEKSAEFIREYDFYNVQIILTETASQANQVRRKILNGEDFETLATENSLDSSKENGGKLGWIRPNDLPDRVATRLPSLRENSVSTPISTTLGHFLVVVLETRKSGDIQTLEEVREIIEFRIKARNFDFE